MPRQSALFFNLKFLCYLHLKKKKKLFRDVYISSNQTNTKLAPNNFPSFPKKKKKKGSVEVLIV